MLKLTYIEDGLHMERVSAPLEVLIAQRVTLVMQAGQRLHIEPGQASFLLRAETPGLARLERVLRLEQTLDAVITPVDSAFVEVTVKGCWIAETVDAESGIFVTTLSDVAEFLVMKLWQAMSSQFSSLA